MEACSWFLRLFLSKKSSPDSDWTDGCHKKGVTKMNSNKSGEEAYRTLEYLQKYPFGLYFYLLKNLDMSTSVWVLYLAFKGMNLWQIGILEGGTTSQA